MSWRVANSLLQLRKQVNEAFPALVASKDPRVKYIIFERQITVPGDITRWKPYFGKNAHNHHVHISVSATPKLYDDVSPWKLNFKAKAPLAPETPLPRLLKRGSRGDGVKALQNALVELGFVPKGKVDGVFGPKTELAVKLFQSANRLTPDGIAGTLTLKALGL